MTERHREMARRLVLGERQCDVAHALGISQPRMSDIARSPVFKAYMNRLATRRELGTEDVLSQVKKGAANGLDLLLRILTEGTPENREANLNTRVKVAQGLLDMEGSIPRVSKKQTARRSVSRHLTSEDIAELKRRAAASRHTNPAA